MSFNVRHQTGDEKPCRACTDFKSWLKTGPAEEHKKETPPPTPDGAAAAVLTSPPHLSKPESTAPPPPPPTVKPPSFSNTEQVESSAGGGREREPADQADLDQRAGLCPPDRSGLGSATWTLLHSVAAYFPSRPRHGRHIGTEIIDL